MLHLSLAAQTPTPQLPGISPLSVAPTPPTKNVDGASLPTPSPLPSGGASVVTSAGGTPTEAELRQAWISFLRKLTSETTQKPVDWTAAVSALVGGLLTAIVTFGALYFNSKREDKRLAAEAVLEQQKLDAEAERQREKARTEGQLSYAAKFLDVRLNQLQLFYAPLNALLQQSRGVYEKVEQLLLKDPSKYRRIVDPAFEDGRTKLEVYWSEAEGWLDFRWLDQLPSLKKDQRVKPLVDEVMRIGKEMTRIISKYGAFAASEELPSDIYGKYLAHFAIITSVYNDPREEPYRPGEQAYGYYPRELNGVVKAGYESALTSLKQYLEASNVLLNDLKRQGVAHQPATK
jgi:hypothetical protein